MNFDIHEEIKLVEKEIVNWRHELHMNVSY